MFHFVYLLHSKKTDRFYVGLTCDLKKRLKEHNSGSNFSTKPYTPWELIFFEGYLEKSDASRREKYLKTSQGSRLVKRMIKDYVYKLKAGKNNQIFTAREGK